MGFQDRGNGDFTGAMILFGAVFVFLVVATYRRQIMAAFRYMLVGATASGIRASRRVSAAGKELYREAEDRATGQPRSDEARKSDRFPAQYGAPDDEARRD
jgi:hypothetical protein